MKTFAVFPGNCPHNVSKDAKYSVRGTDGRVGLTVLHCGWRAMAHDHESPS